MNNDIWKNCIKFPGSSFFRDWQWVSEEFTDGMKFLQKNREKIENKSHIWETKSTRVWKLELPESLGSKTVALKSYYNPPPYRYMLRNSILAREALNYYRLDNLLNIPTAKLLAVGDYRFGLRLKGGFIVTSFVENSRDGRLFMKNGIYEEDASKRDFFCHEVLTILAKMHHGNFWHRGTHPYNFLFVEENDKESVVVIDLGTGRFRKSFTDEMAVHDVDKFLRSIPVSEEIKNEYRNFYREQRASLK